MMILNGPASEKPVAASKIYHQNALPSIAAWELSDSGDGDGSVSDLPTSSGARFFFCNVRGLDYNFHFVDHHLSSTIPQLLFLTETQMSELDSKPYSVNSYTLFIQFSAKGGCCSYVRSDITCSRVSDLESSMFSSIWLRLSCQSTSKFICSVYLSPNSTDYPKFFDYLNSKIKHILSHSPFPETIILGDFNVHHRHWLCSSSHDPAGELPFDFSIRNNLEQLVGAVPYSYS